ncbi:M23 family metallopeptidase [Novosphingobium olei]|uniref:M23 family metallopeptidase n=1 Tax=Novosphingobium olei TaxID=2728851 RepID=UPI003BAF4BE2
MERWQDKLRLIATTAAITSAVWLVAGALWMNGGARSSVMPQSLVGAPGPAPAVPHPAASPLAPVPAMSGSLVLPVQGVRPADLTDTYTQARAGGARIHDAIDIMAPSGTPVLAAMAGRVDKLFLSNDGGNTIYIRSPDGRTMAYYAHLSAYAPDLAEGQAVRAGQVIGAVGATGNADPGAPHLHFALLRTTPEARWDQGEPINPFPLLRALP